MSRAEMKRAGLAAAVRGILASGTSVWGLVDMFAGVLSAAGLAPEGAKIAKVGEELYLAAHEHSTSSESPENVPAPTVKIRISHAAGYPVHASAVTLRWGDLHDQVGHADADLRRSVDAASPSGARPVGICVIDPDSIAVGLVFPGMHLHGFRMPIHDAECLVLRLQQVIVDVRSATRSPDVSHR